jgi:hypothetical protein
MVESVLASIPQPAIPEFSLKFVKSSYNVTDQYSGDSQQVDSSTIEVTIKNQLFTTVYNKIDATSTSLYYNIQIKGHYANDWTEVYNSHNGSYPPYVDNFAWYDYPIQSNSEYTTLSIPANYPVDSKLDFHIQAIIANVTDLLLPNFLPDYGARYHSDADYIHQIAWTAMSLSDWSPTQTLTIADESNSTSITTSPYPTLIPTITTPTPTPTAYSPTKAPTTNDTQPQANALIPLMNVLLTVMILIVIIAVAIVVGLSLLLYRSRNKITH